MEALRALPWEPATAANKKAECGGRQDHMAVWAMARRGRRGGSAGASVVRGFRVWRGLCDIILGKPWLHSVRAIHDYDSDEIQIRAEGGEALLRNEPAGVAELKPLDAEEARVEVDEACGAEGTEVAEMEAEEDVGAEAKWQRDEKNRLARKTAKEQARKAAQLERRAEQPLPFPGLGYSPPPRIDPKPREPRPFPIGKPAPSALTTTCAPAPDEECIVQRAQGHSRELGDDECQIEEEYAWISLVQVHAPWTETRFAKYLSIDPILDADSALEIPTEGMGQQGRELLDGRQPEKRLRTSGYPSQTPHGPKF
ncbi:hypothetical protein B0H19DRAFT_1267584 [Mycena capillaripes]|nr:hypothetical protein B0H19DRAFT_1267584 [Mycena capillaripes]